MSAAPSVVALAADAIAVKSRYRPSSADRQAGSYAERPTAYVPRDLAQEAAAILRFGKFAPMDKSVFAGTRRAVSGWRGTTALGRAMIPKTREVAFRSREEMPERSSRNWR